MRGVVAVGLLFSLLSVTPAGAQVGPLTWNFDQSSTGADVNWVSPTAIDPGAAVYNASLEFTLIEVDVSYLGTPQGTVDVTPQIPPDQLVTEGELLGPLPIQSAGAVLFPDPPLPTAVSADLGVGLDANGFGTVDVTNLFLGTFQIDVGFPLGVVTVDITRLRVAGTLTIHATFFDLGMGLPGSAGDTRIELSGVLRPSTPVTMTLTNAPPFSTALVVFSGFQANLPFAGGTLVPRPDGIVGLGSGIGTVVVPGFLPPVVPSGATFYTQTWVIDPNVPQGFSASNAIRGHTP